MIKKNKIKPTKKSIEIHPLVGRTSGVWHLGKRNTKTHTHAHKHTAMERSVPEFCDRVWWNGCRRCGREHLQYTHTHVYTHPYIHTCINTGTHFKSFYTVYISLECFFICIKNTFISIVTFLFSTNTESYRPRSNTGLWPPPFPPLKYIVFTFLCL